MADNSIGFTAVYDDVDSALADLDALDNLHDDKVVGDYDAAVVDLEDGEPHIVKRADHPRVNVLPELVGKGALPSGEVKDAAKGLDQGQAALVFVGDPTLDKAFEQAVTRARKVARQEFAGAADQLTDALRGEARS
jgi:hypothetical protein